MKGCSNYRHESTGLRNDGLGSAKKLRFILVIVIAIAAIVFVFVVWPMLSSPGVTVEGNKQAVASANPDGLQSASSAQPKADDLAAADASSASNKMLVYVTGAVLNPGVFEFDGPVRLNDAVLMAGGLAENAAKNYVNLAATLADGDHIHIPTIEELSSGEADRIAALAGNNAGAKDGLSTDKSLGGAKGDSKAGPVNINTASSEDLEALPGIGPATAQRIIDFREKNGAYKNIEDLKSVSGIGDKKFADLASKVCV